MGASPRVLTSPSPRLCEGVLLFHSQGQEHLFDGCCCGEPTQDLTTFKPALAWLSLRCRLALWCLCFNHIGGGRDWGSPRRLCLPCPTRAWQPPSPGSHFYH